MLYFVRIPDGRIKIGVTEDFIKRRYALGSLYGRPIRLLSLIPGWEPEESAMHARFAAIRSPRNELFEATEELLTFIANLPRPKICTMSEVECGQRLLDEAPRFSDSMLSVRQAALELDIDRHELRGWIDGMGINLIPAGHSLMMSRADLERLRKRLGKPEPHAVTAAG